MHPYHNNPILSEIKQLEALARSKRRKFETEEILPIKQKIQQLKNKRRKELEDYDLNNHQ